MPFIRIYSYSGRDLETKKKCADAVVKAASEVLGAPLTAFTVAFEDHDRENWESEVTVPVIEPMRDLIVYENGEML